MPIEQLVAHLATKGLIRFRKGFPEEGRSLYRQAIAVAHRNKDKREAIALLYLTLEELRIRSALAESTKSEALTQSTSLTDPIDLMLVDRVRTTP